MPETSRIPEEILIAYCDGSDVGEDRIAEIRRSDWALNWVRDYRLVRILSGEKGRSQASSDVSESELIDFWNENLPQTRMAQIEAELSINSGLFDAYTAIRENTVMSEHEVPESLDRHVRQTIISRANRATIDHQKGSTALGAWLSGISQRLDNLLPKRQSMWVSALVTACVVLAVFVFTSPGKNPRLFLVADLKQIDQELTFRGKASEAKIRLSEDGSLAFATLSFSKDLEDPIQDYAVEPTEKNLGVLLSGLDAAVRILVRERKTGEGPYKALDVTDFSGLQIEPALWLAIQDGRSPSHIVVSVDDAAVLIEDTKDLTGKKLLVLRESGR